MANHGYMTLIGETQGLISAGCSTQESIGNKCQEGHRDQIMVLSYNHKMFNEGNLGASTHGPVVITKKSTKHLLYWPRHCPEESSSTASSTSTAPPNSARTRSTTPST